MTLSARDGATADNRTEARLRYEKSPNHDRMNISAIHSMS